MTDIYQKVREGHCFDLLERASRVPQLHYWEEFHSLAAKWHSSKAEMNGLCALVEDKCLNHFKNILKKKEV
jgi:hypothetical protein